MDGVDLALQRVTDIIDLSYGRLLPHAQTLLFYTSVIEITLLFLLYAFGRQETVADLIKKMLVIGFFVWVIRDFQSIVNAIFASAAELGVIAGTTESATPAVIDQYLTPSSLIRHGAGLFGQMLERIGDLPWDWGLSDIAKALVMALLFALIAIIILIGFTIGGIRVLMTTIEFHLLTSLVLVILPFSVLRPTAFIGERSIAIVVSLSVKMMVTLFVLTLVDSVLNEMQTLSGGTLEWADLVPHLVIGILVPILIWVAPNLAAGLMSGNPTLNAGQFVVSTAGMAVAGGAVAAGAVAAPILGASSVAALGKMGASARIASAGASSSGAAPGAAGAGGAGGAGPRPGGGPTGGGPTGGSPSGGGPSGGGSSGGGSPGGSSGGGGAAGSSSRRPAAPGPSGGGSSGGSSSGSGSSGAGPSGGSAQAGNRSSGGASSQGSSSAPTSGGSRGGRASGAGASSGGPASTGSSGAAASGGIPPGGGSGAGPSNAGSPGSAPASGSSTTGGTAASGSGSRRGAGTGARSTATGSAPSGKGGPGSGSGQSGSQNPPKSRLASQLARRGYQARLVKSTATRMAHEPPHDTPTPSFKDGDV